MGGARQQPSAGGRSAARLWTEFGALIGIFGAAFSVAAFVRPTGSIAQKILLAVLMVSLSALVWRGITLWLHRRVDPLFVFLTVSTLGLVVWYSALVVGTTTGGGRPSRSAPQTSSLGNLGWMEVRSGQDFTLADGQTIDFDSGTVGDVNAAGIDMGLDERADQLWVPNETTRLALLDASGAHTADRCATLPPDQWENMIRGVYGLAVGRDICLATSERRNVIITLDRIPDSIVNTLTFHYTVWERR